MSKIPTAEQVKAFVRTLPATTMHILKNIPVFVWPLPILFALIVVALSYTQLGWMTEKPEQEIVAPVIIGMTAGLVIFVHRWVGERFSLLLALFVWSLFMRELHFWGTNNGFYLAFIAIVIWSWVSRAQLAQFLECYAIRSFLSCALLFYAFSKVMDRGYLAFLPDFRSWHHNLEETLESGGHLLVFCLVIVTLRFAHKMSQKS